MVSLHESNTCYVMSIFHPTIFASPYGYTVIFIIACNTYCSIYIFWLCICFLFFVYITLWVDVIYLMWTNRQHLNYWPFFSPSLCFTFTDELKIQVTLNNHFPPRHCIIFKLSYGICWEEKKNKTLKIIGFLLSSFLSYVYFLFKCIQTILAFSMKFLVSLLKSLNSIILST